MENPLIAIRFVHFTAAMLAFGLLGFRLYALRSLQGVEAIDRMLTRGACFYAGIGLITALLWLGVETGLMNDSVKATFDIRQIWVVLTDTGFGHAWQWRLGFGVVLLILTARRVSSVAQTICAAGFLASLAFTGHAMIASGAMGAIHRLNQSLHLLAAGAWVGGLFALGYTLKYATDPTARRDILLRFSGMGYAVVTIILITGVFNSWMMIGSPDRLLMNAYGRLLTVKIMLVLMMVVLAAVNRLAWLPHIERENIFRRLTAAIVAEQILGLLVLAAVSSFATLPPA